MVETPDFEKEKIERLRRAMYSRSMSGDIRERERRTLHEDAPPVGEEWHAEETQTAGVHVAPRFLGATRRILMWILAASIVFFVLAVAVFAYYFTFGGGSLPANPANIDIVVTGPPQIAAGEPTELQISVTNRNRIPLQLSDLVITFPSGTRKTRSDVVEMPELTQSLGTIEPGGRRQGTVSAVFVGAAGEHKNVKVELEYRVTGSNAIFVASTDYAVVFSSSPVSLSIDGNTQTVSGQPLDFTVNVTSNANASLKDVLLSVHYPFGFQFVRANPAPSASGFWELGDFSPGQRKTVQIEGVLSGEQGDSRVFRVDAGTREDASSKTIATQFASNAYGVQISHPFLGLRVMTEGQSGTTIAEPGQRVNVSLEYENNLSTEISDIILVARLSGAGVAPASVQAAEGFYRSTDNSILWDKGTASSKLASLAPGEKGSVTFSFTVPSSEALQSAANPEIGISVSAAGKRISESSVPQSLESTAQKKIVVASDTGLCAQALYYQNPFSSTGPLPPKAETETTYALIFTVINTTSALTDVKVKAELPSYVRWLGVWKPSTESLTFNQLAGTFTWDLGDVAAGTGIGTVPSRQLAVAIGLTPSISQIGQQPALVRDVKLSGRDEATGQLVERAATPDVTTNLLQIGRTSSICPVGTDRGFTASEAQVVAP